MAHRGGWPRFAAQVILVIALESQTFADMRLRGLVLLCENGVESEHAPFLQTDS